MSNCLFYNIPFCSLFQKSFFELLCNLLISCIICRRNTIRNTAIVVILATFCIVLVSNAIFQLFSLQRVKPGVSVYQIQNESSDATVKHFEGIRAIVQMDKEVYRPGETANIRVVMVHGENGTLFKREPRGQNIKLNVITPKKESNPLYARRYQYGVYSAHYFASITEGLYNLEVIVGNNSFSFTKPFTIASYHKGRVFMEISLDKDTYNQGDTALITVQSSLLDGSLQETGEMTINAVINGEQTKIFSGIAKTNGTHTAMFKIPSQASILSSLVSVSFNINGEIETATKVIPIISKNHGSVDIFPEGGFIGCDVKNRIYFQALDAFNKSVNVEGKVVDSTNTKVADIIAGIDGRGKSEFFMVDPKLSYFLEITSPSQFSGKRTVLPLCKPYPVMSAQLEGNKIRAEIRASKKTGMWLQLSRLHHVITTIPVSKDSNVLLDPSGYYGVLRLTLWMAGKEGCSQDGKMAVSERLIFVPPPKPSISLQIRHTSNQTGLLFHAKERVRVIPDFGGKFGVAMMAVVDKRNIENMENFRNQMMDAYLLDSEVSQLTNQMKRFIHESNLDEIDLILAVQQWRRFVFECPDSAPPSLSSRLLGNVTFVLQREKRPIDIRFNRMARGGILGAVPLARDMDAVAEEAAVEEDQAIQVNQAIQANQAMAMNAVPAMPAFGVERGMQVLQAKVVPPKMMAMNMREGMMAMKRMPGMRPMPGGNMDFFVPPPLGETPDTLVWNPFMPVENTEEPMEWNFNLRGVSSTYVIYVGFIGPQGIEEKTAEIVSQKLLSMEAKWKAKNIFLCEDDVMKLPISLVNNADFDFTVEINGTEFKHLLSLQASETVVPRQSNTRGYLEMQAHYIPNQQTHRSPRLSSSQSIRDVSPRSHLTLRLEENSIPGVSEYKHFTVQVRSRNTPIKHTDVISLVNETKPLVIHLPSTSVDNRGNLQVTNLNQFSSLLLESARYLIGEPTGCFEQTSSSLYPMVQLASLGSFTGAKMPILHGLERLLSFEVENGGFSWFGRKPAHESLTSLGLLQFQAMKPLLEKWRETELAAKMEGAVNRTKTWLFNRFDKKKHTFSPLSTESLDSFGRADPSVQEAYVLYALSCLDDKEDMEKELVLAADRFYFSISKQLITNTYVYALIAITYRNLGVQEKARFLEEKILANLREDGSFEGSEMTITYSRGNSLLIETAALCGIALSSEQMAAKMKIRDFLLQHYSNGRFGSTQGTIFSLQFLGEMDAHLNSPVRFIVDGEEFVLKKKPMADIPLLAGDHTITITSEGNVTVALTTSYSIPVPENTNSTLEMQFLSRNPMIAKEGVVLNQEIRVANKGEAMGMVTAVIGLPSGVEVEMEHMKAIQEKGTFDYFEIREGDLIIYWESVPAKFERVFQIAMIPLVPGAFRTPASFVYEYYNKENIYWVPGTVLSLL